MTRHVIFPRATHRVQRPTRGSGWVSGGHNHAAGRAADVSDEPRGERRRSVRSRGAHSALGVPSPSSTGAGPSPLSVVAVVVPCRHLPSTHFAYLYWDLPLPLSATPQRPNTPRVCTTRHSSRLGRRQRCLRLPSQDSAEPHTSSSHGCKHTAALGLKTM